MSIYSGLNKCLPAAILCTMAVLAGCDEEVDDPSFELQLDADLSTDEQAAGLAEDVDGLPTSLPFERSGERYTLPARGGFGGTPYTLGCPSGRVAVGIYGRSGAYIDRLGLTCARLYKSGNLGASDDVGAHGGNGGYSFRLSCPYNQAIVGIYGGAGSYLDRIGLHCADVKDWYDDNELGHTTSSTGGSGGWSFSDLCPRRYMVARLNVRTGVYVDQIEPVCVYIED